MVLGWREEIREGFLEKDVFWWTLKFAHLLTLFILLHLLSLLIKIQAP